MDADLTLMDLTEDESSDEEDSFTKRALKGRSESLSSLHTPEQSFEETKARPTYLDLADHQAHKRDLSSERQTFKPNNMQQQQQQQQKNERANGAEARPMPQDDCCCCVVTVSLLVCIVAFGVGLYLRVQNNETCASGWIPNNITGLEKTLEKKLHGQHVAKAVVLRTLRGHLRNAHPKKALVLSLHGQVGIGKSFVSSLIIDQLYYKGSSSCFVHKKIGSLDFPHHNKVAEYKEELKTLVRNAVKNCPQSLFVFEEVHEFPDGLLEVLSPYLDNHDSIDGVDYRKAIFIFTSNTGGSAINKFAVEHREKNGTRESITHKDLDNLLTKVVFNANGGLWEASLIRHKMVSAFVGFLPLEKEHVEQCARDDALTKGFTFTTDALKQVAEEMTYYPDGREYFSTYGCKGVTEAVDTLFQ